MWFGTWEVTGKLQGQQEDISGNNTGADWKVQWVGFGENVTDYDFWNCILNPPFTSFPFTSFLKQEQNINILMCYLA